MIHIESIWRMNLPATLGLLDFGLDDADLDALGNLYVSDSINARVYKFQLSGILTNSFEIQPGVGNGESAGLSLAVAQDSAFYIGDPTGGLVSRYSESGDHVGEFAVPGLLCLCSRDDGFLYAVSSYEGIDRISMYNPFGFLENEIAAPPRGTACLDPAFANVDADSSGNIYVSYGMAPYAVYKIKPDGCEIEKWSREIDFPDNAVLISDIALDKKTGILWVLLACKSAGRQQIDAYSPEGELICSMSMPHSDNLFGVICAYESRLYLLDTGIGPGAGDLLCMAVS